ncbi:MAG TPA: TlpA disulfide reductase family protein [Tepidisphaeraceae bacterium]|nr:TlpA disulfide reductase family protein [Tepidisphaeraceae bacterium]
MFRLSRSSRSLVVAVVGMLAVAMIAAPALLLADQPDDKKEQLKDANADPVAAGLTPEAAAEPAGAEQPKAAVTPDAQQVIEKVDAAYAKLKSLELAGTFSADIDAAGRQQKESRKFTSAFAAPNKFRHRMDEDVLVGSTGEKAYAFLEAKNLYATADAPRERVGVQQLPEPIPQVLPMQNPGLMLAMAKSPSSELSSIATEIKKVDDTKLPSSEGGPEATYPTLQLTLPNKMVVTMLFHPQTHLLRQARTDARSMLEQGGTPDVKSASFTVDYTSVTADGAVKDEQFAWAPPKDARDLAEMAAAEGGAPGGQGGAASELEGKPAPAFTLKDMADKDVKLADLKGQVVVLDLWATWCPPCRASLPHLDKLHEEMKDKGVKVYAVNVQEEKADVEQFIQQTNLKTPVLLDSKGEVSQKYKANAIPQTVVIGKDGKVARVFIGFGGEQSAKDLKAAVEAAKKG